MISPDHRLPTVPRGVNVPSWVRWLVLAVTAAYSGWIGVVAADSLVGLVVRLVVLFTLGWIAMCICNGYSRARLERDRRVLRTGLLWHSTSISKWPDGIPAPGTLITLDPARCRFRSRMLRLSGLGPPRRATYVTARPPQQCPKWGVPVVGIDMVLTLEPVDLPGEVWLRWDGAVALTAPTHLVVREVRVLVKPRR